MGLKISQLPDKAAEDGMMIPASVGGMTYKLPVGGPGGIAKTVTPSALGNLATLDAAGNLGDSGKNPGNFAPSGFGYGDVNTALQFSNDTDGTIWTAAADAQLQAMPNGACKQYKWSDYPFCPETASGGFGTLYSAGGGGSNAVFVGCLWGNAMLMRQKNNGVWQPWEWVNPPMQLGVEYRTTERYMGKPVYVRFISNDTGWLNNNAGGGAVIADMLADTTNIIDIDFVIKNRTTQETQRLPSFNTDTGAITAVVAAGRADGYQGISFFTRCFADMTSWDIVRFVAKYTKTTD